MKKKTNTTKVAKSKTSAKNKTGQVGRPAGTGNYTVTLKDLVAKVGEDAKIPVIKSFLDIVGLKGTPFTTNKQNLAEITKKYTEANAPAPTQTEGGSVTKVDLTSTNA